MTIGEGVAERGAVVIIDVRVTTLLMANGPGSSAVPRKEKMLTIKIAISHGGGRISMVTL